MNENVILVDAYDREIGTMEKMQAHREAALHRAFSVFILNENDEMLIHQRAHDKYHSGGLWTNACCSHPRPGESVEEAATRRLKEEMGMNVHVEKKFSFIYHAPLGNQLFEHELDHVLLGVSNESPQPNPEEVADWKYVSLYDLQKDIKENPKIYTAWFKIALPMVLREINRSLLKEEKI